MAEERIYTIPLRKEWQKVSIHGRGGKANRAAKEFLNKHMKKEVKLGPYLNEFIWGKGNRHPPPRVKVRIEQDGETLTAELINAPRKEKKTEKKADKKEVKAVKVDEKKEEALKEKQEETKKAIEKVPAAHELTKESGLAEERNISQKKEKVIPKN